MFSIKVETPQQIEIKELAQKFGLSVDEVKGHFADANDPIDFGQKRRPHPSHRVRELEPDYRYARSRAARFALGGD